MTFNKINKTFTQIINKLNKNKIFEDQSFCVEIVLFTNVQEIYLLQFYC